MTNKHQLTPLEVKLITLLKEEITEHTKFYELLIQWIENGMFQKDLKEDS